MDSIMLASECKHVRLFTELFDALGYRLHLTSNLPEEINAATHWERRTVWLDRRLTGLRARFSLEHEMQHVLRGPLGKRLGAPASRAEMVAEENACDLLAAEAMWAAGLPVDVEWIEPWTVEEYLGDANADQDRKLEGVS